MRKVSVKRKSGRRSTKNEEENGVADKSKDNGDASSNNEQEDQNSDTAESEDYEPEPEKKRKTDKRKSVSFSSKKKPEAEAQYEVESVLDEKIIKGVKHYLIRWKGYEPESDTWEPESTLSCNDLIKEYHAQQKPKSEKDKKEGDSKRKSKSVPKIKIKDVNWGENEEFEVERILEVHHKRDGKREFLVSWKGYPPSENSWEPEENMTCADLIERFMARVEKAKVVDLRELREKRTHTDRFTLQYNDKGRRLSKRNKGKQRVQYHDAE